MSDVVMRETEEPVQASDSQSTADRGTGSVIGFVWALVLGGTSAPFFIIAFIALCLKTGTNILGLETVVRVYAN